MGDQRQDNKLICKWTTVYHNAIHFAIFLFVRGDKKQAVNNEMINTGDIVLAK
jgi:hypothetical protein